MNWIRAARAIGGLLSIVTLLALITADFAFDRTLTTPMLVLLLALISALLGVDIAREKLPLRITIDNPKEDKKQ